MVGGDRGGRGESGEVVGRGVLVRKELWGRLLWLLWLLLGVECEIHKRGRGGGGGFGTTIDRGGVGLWLWLVMHVGNRREGGVVKISDQGR